ncbi:TIM barrel protein [uncultured Selenomonas sp.]|uniref:TIM barrel protein n=1 Tax=uncultured Selenomonas sp. TaxID=159275 RepID=UPI0028D5A9FE|nr:TIM barrel protein [uncultured Selenomonas sp.]
MLELTNLSNADCDVESILQNDPNALADIVQAHHLDGIEFMRCAPWNRVLYPPAYIKGVHLMFWPVWLDFWRSDRAALMEEFGSEENIRAYYGTLDPAVWVEAWRENLRQAAECRPQYVVFHVAHNRTSEMYTRRFAVGDEEVVAAVVALVNEIAPVLPENCKLLFENLWWPGLTFQKPHLAERLLTRVSYPHTGFMLDTGHLMNTNLDLRDEADGAAYVEQIYYGLGELGRYVYGVHLHQSISGVYTREMMRRHADWNAPLGWRAAMDYVMHVDLHQPFQTDAARRIVDMIAPMYLVHEFQHRSREDLENKLNIQQTSLLTL